ncbi:MAG: hypothetical protein WC783_04500 [Candidatus Paceibacterota bacterium]|jgi:hypothetical protein
MNPGIVIITDFVAVVVFIFGGAFIISIFLRRLKKGGIEVSKD